MDDDDGVLHPVRLFGLPLLLGVGVVTTIYDQWVFRWLALFFAAPAYTIVGVISLAYIVPEHYRDAYDLVSKVSNVGFIWVGVKVVWRWRRHIVEKENNKARQAAEEVRKVAEEKRERRAHKQAERESEKERAGIGDGNAANSRSSSGGASNSSVGGNFPKCEKCIESYRILDLQPEAGRDEVKAKRRIFAEFLHPDKLGNKSEQARRAAEQQLKNINEACDQILRCGCSQPRGQCASM
jgi:hypothetical protein